MNEIEIPHVYTAINEVQKRLSETGVSKSRKNQQQNYSFRGIDDIYNALSSIMAESGLCILPNVESREIVERETKSGSALFYVTVKVHFHFVSSKDGSSHIVTTYGEAMDSADKATNKAMSAAYKYACLQAFCIPTEGDNDADSTTHEVISNTAKTEAQQSVNADQAILIRDLVIETKTDIPKFLAAYKAESIDKFPLLQFSHAHETLMRKKAKIESEANHGN